MSDDQLPVRADLIAILRGLEPVEAPAVGEVLYDAGLRSIEVPLNSPRPFESIRALTSHLPDDCLVGAGTVVNPADVDRVLEAGGNLVVAPNTDAAVITRAVDHGLCCYPGVATATDVFTAVKAGTSTLKIFPADQLGIATMTAWQAVAPKSTAFYPVGGINSTNLRQWMDAGAAGAGIGSSLFVPGRELEDLRVRAQQLVSSVGRYEPPQRFEGESR